MTMWQLNVVNCACLFTDSSPGDVRGLFLGGGWWGSVCKTRLAHQSCSHFWFPKIRLDSQHFSIPFFNLMIPHSTLLVLHKCLFCEELAVVQNRSVLKNTKHNHSSLIQSTIRMSHLSYLCSFKYDTYDVFVSSPWLSWRFGLVVVMLHEKTPYSCILTH